MKTNENESDGVYHPIRALVCPHCHKDIGYAVDVTGTRNTPKENDLATCPYCEHASKFNADLDLVIVIEDNLNPFEKLLIAASRLYGQRVRGGSLHSNN